MKIFQSDLSKKEFPVSEKICGKTLRHSIINLIQKEYPQFTTQNCLSIDGLDYYREKYISEYLNGQIDELTEMKKTVLTSLSEKTTLSDKIEGDEKQTLTFGQRLTNKVATFGGSWTFIISFGIFISIWISANIFWLFNKGFEPYPFILLNLKQVNK